MSRIATDFLAAAPGARRALEQAQRQIAFANHMRTRRPELFQPETNPRWMFDRTLNPGFRQTVALAEASAHLRAGLTRDDLRILVVPSQQIRELPEMTPGDTWQAVMDGERLPFPCMWIETTGSQIEMVAPETDREGKPLNWPSTGTPYKLMHVLGFLVEDFEDSLLFQPVMLEDVAGASPEIAAGVKHDGQDLNPTSTLVIPRDPISYSGPLLDAATVVLRENTPDGFIVESAPCGWIRKGDQKVADPEIAPILGMAEGLMPALGGLLMLLSSVNVDTQKDRLALPRDARRAVKRGAVEPMFVYIRQRRRKSDGGGSETGRKLQVRHEVRGHFKHYGPDTRIYQAADPKQRRFDPERGWHVRYWTRPHVRGPEDAPLRIKPRRLSHPAPSSDSPLRNDTLTGTRPPIFDIDTGRDAA